MSYKTAAQAIFSELTDNGHIFKESVSRSTLNIWRLTWALDTINDYFRYFDNSKADNFFANFATPQSIDGYNGYYLDANNGAWWDDFGWDGIASLRCALTTVSDMNLKINLVKNAINCWCYMYGTGWDGKNNYPNPFSVPYPDVFNWSGKADLQSNVGAPNVYSYWKDTLKIPDAENYCPRHAPGGLWNSKDSNCSHPTPTKPDYTSGHLSGFQNTVTNTLFTVLSLRIYLLLMDPAYQHIFTDAQSPISTDVVYQAWYNQITWFNQWATPDNIQTDETLLFNFIPNPDQTKEATLMRERVSLVKNGMWNPTYSQYLSWLGDQGLMFGINNDIETFITENESKFPDVAKLKITDNDRLINGVLLAFFSNNGYTNDCPCQTLRPWVQYQVPDNHGGNDNTYAPFPFDNDDGDYRTGIAVFCRYLLQAIENGYTIPDALKTNITTLANNITYYNSCTTIPTCDGMCSSGKEADRYTNLINQLAILCVAEKLNAN